MTEEKSREICKKCKWRDLKLNKQKKPEHWCREAGTFISLLTKCPL